ncbi:hypothetical protein NF699_13850 [Sphingomonadaceae bacterium OTU29LAMAA1]|nr:hypothetical protein NF699_13850 [Sphingomonadaceae bacterium OTU29LAMAA1]
MDMADERNDQIEQLLIAVAGIMEDVSAMLLDANSASVAARIEMARRAGERIAILSETAAALFDAAGS